MSCLPALTHSAMARWTIHPPNPLCPFPSPCLCYEWVFSSDPLAKFLPISKDPAQMSPLLWSIPQGQDDALFISVSPAPGTESKLMKCLLNEPVNETEEQSQYPMTDKNLGFVIWQTCIFMDLFLDLQRSDLGQITASFGEVTSLAVQ